jgi:hypothetical protein
MEMPAARELMDREPLPPNPAEPRAPPLNEEDAPVRALAPPNECH